MLDIRQLRNINNIRKHGICHAFFIPIINLMRTILFLSTLLFLGACNADNRQALENLAPDANIATIDDSIPVRTIRVQKSGEDLFEGNCTSCHAIKYDITGPALKGITERRNREWLLAFTRDSWAVISSGDEYAVALYNKWNSMMTPFPNLDSSEIMLIYDYIEAESKN
jgi:mono/diheme cytochrome c family protein